MSDQLKQLDKETHKKFREKIVNNDFVFSLIDVLRKNMVYQMPSYEIFCHCFYCRRGSKSQGTCYIFSRFFVDDNNISKKIDCEFIITKSSLAHLPIYNVMDQVNTKLFWTVIIWLVITLKKALKILGKYSTRLSNNPFGLYMFYLEIYPRVSFDLLKPVSEAITDNYLSEDRCSKEKVSEVKKRINNILVSWYCEAGKELVK